MVNHLYYDKYTKIIQMLSIKSCLYNNISYNAIGFLNTLCINCLLFFTVPSCTFSLSSYSYGKQ